ncbi:16S rRNA (adenine(1518)-N(6)/adenine(1519)-N(6))-dimethyltransferase RsmA [Stetteria hydrogenophila]
MRPPPTPPTRRGLLRWTRQALAWAGVERPVKRLGQHFLVDPAVINAFRRALSPWAGSDMVEVGVGLGTLAYYVSDLASRIHACDIDERLARAAAGILPGNVQVTVEDGVVLAAAAVEPVIYSNAPYNASTPLIAAAARNNNVKALVLVVQKEVAYRLTAKPGSGDYGRLSVLASRFFEARLLGVFRGSSFHPPPEVDSALVALVRRRDWDPGVDPKIEELTRCLFTQRNRLALRAVERCTGSRPGGGLSSRLEGKRVRDLTHEDLEAIVAQEGLAGAASTSRQTTRS